MMNFRWSFFLFLRDGNLSIGTTHKKQYNFTIWTKLMGWSVSFALFRNLERCSLASNIPIYFFIIKYMK